MKGKKNLELIICYFFSLLITQLTYTKPAAPVDSLSDILPKVSENK
jgi:hypothetical protein